MTIFSFSIFVFLTNGKMLRQDELLGNWTMRVGGDAFKASCAQLNQGLKELQSSCLFQTCDRAASYRLLDGCCNNLESKLRGSANTALPRLLPSAYLDGVSLPRGGLTSSSLPSARAVSVAVHQDHEENNHKEVTISQMVMQWGQFLDHDTSLIQGKDFTLSQK